MYSRRSREKFGGGSYDPSGWVPSKGRADFIPTLCKTRPQHAYLKAKARNSRHLRISSILSNLPSWKSSCTLLISKMLIFLHILTTLLALACFRGIGARYNGFRHEAVDASNKNYKRLDPVFVNCNITEQCPTPTRSIYSLVFPSPDASAVEVTAQSQVITTFLPEMTWCVGPPVGLVPASVPPYLNQSTEYKTTIGGTGYCETVYVPTETTVCATTLTGIASKVTVSECDQEITFSSECGFTLQTPTPVTTNSSLITPAPTVKRMMTYWLAPWQSLTAGDTPSDVDIKICTLGDDENMECIRYQEVWEVVVITNTITTSRDVQLTTTVTGPGTLIIETMQAYITDTVETVDLSTTLLLQTEIETESTSKRKKLTTRLIGGNEPIPSTLYLTKHLKYRTSEYVISSQFHRRALISHRPELTTTVRMTSVVHIIGTITQTRARPLPTLLEMLDF